MLQASRPTHGFSFGPFELDSDTGELRSSGTPVHLQPQPTQILKILLENHGKLVTREQIQQQLWSEETFVEFEVGLNQAIKKLREALGDSAQTPLYIETIPRKGYRFIAEVQAIEQHGLTDPLLGRVLGHYRLVERIGQGGMGIVYRAHDEHLKRDVAIKILPQGAVADGTSRHRFRKEAMALAKLNHPNIAAVSDFDTQEGLDFLVEELIPGTSLDQMLMANPLTEKQLINLGTQLCEGLAAAHEQGVIHRDIKPANLRLTSDGRLKILDFGLAAVLREPNTKPDEDVTASVLEAQATSGTLPYMAPEQLLNEKLDARTDLWAAGCVLYEMATGRLPFGGSGMALADAILHQTPMRPSEVNRKVSPALEAIILKCLEKDPALRYGSAHEIGVDLNRISRTAQGPILKTSRRPIWVRATVAVMVLLAVSVSGYTIWKYVLPRISAKPPVAASNSRRVVAVLYFKNMSQDPSLNWLNGGLTEMMTTNLGQVGGMEVLSTEQLSLIRKRLKYKPDQELPSEAAPEIAREAGADAFITGALMRLGPSRVRVDVRLQEVSTGKILFSDKVESPDLNGVFGMVDTMTAHVADRLLPASQRPEDVPHIEQVATSNMEAYHHYQAGMAYLDRVQHAKAARELEEAVRLDPDFGIAYLGLVAASWGTRDMSRAWQAVAEAERLQKRMPRLAQPWIAYWKSQLAMDDDGAARQLEVILREAPRNSGARMRLARISPASRGVAILREGLVLDPKDDQLWNELAYEQAAAGQEQEALEACDRLQALVGPKDPNAWSTRGDVLFHFGRNAEAASTYLKLRELDPDFSLNYATAMLGIIYAEQGKADLAQQELEALQRDTSVIGRLSAIVLQAQLMQVRGEVEASIPLLRKAVAEAGRGGQTTRALFHLRWFCVSIVSLGKPESELDFVRQQNLQGRELEFVSMLEAAAGHERSAQESLQRLVSASPQTPAAVLEQRRAINHALAALSRGDGTTVLNALQSVPRKGVLLELARGRAQLWGKDYTAAEQSFKEAIFNLRDWGPYYLPAIEHLLHFYLGQTYEATGRHNDAIREYQSFLSHYTNSHSRLPEIAQARAALKRLGA